MPGFEEKRARIYFFNPTEPGFEENDFATKFQVIFHKIPGDFSDLSFGTFFTRFSHVSQELSKKIVGKHKVSYKIDEHHVYMIGRYGPVIKYEKD